MLAWNSLTDKTVIHNYGNRILWNTSNRKMITFKYWQQCGIQYLKNIFDHDRQFFYTFVALKENK